MLIEQNEILYIAIHIYISIYLHKYVIFSFVYLFHEGVGKNLIVFLHYVINFYQC